MKKFLLILITLFAGIHLANSQTQALADTSMELTGAGGTQWTSTSLVFGTVLCDTTSCGTCGGPCVPMSGDWYAWFCGAAALELGTLSQTFNLASAGNGTLHFWMEIPNGGAAVDSIVAFLDGTEIFYKAGNDTTGYDLAYTPVSINLGGLTSGNHTLLFRGVESGTAPNEYDVLIDDITVQISAGGAYTETNMLDEGIRMVNNTAEQSFNVNLHFGEPTDITISILNMSGSIVDFQDFKQVRDYDYLLNTSALASGAYTIYFRKGNTGSFSKKFIIQK